MNSSPRLVLPAVVLALGFFFSALFLSGPLRSYVKARQTITVKGYAERKVESDFALWSATVTTRGKEIHAAADDMDKASREVSEFLSAQGMPKESIGVSDLTTTALNKERGNTTTDELEGFKLDRKFEVTSTDLDRISRLTDAAPVLLHDGLEISLNPPEYYCTGLGDLKVTMLGEAMRDARNRAQEIAGKSGRQIGALECATQGVFQITSVYATETAEEGSLDTESRTKSIKAVVTAEFELN